jgi:group I intron endonuclease
MNTIYKATNKITGKSYIGFDSAWPSRKERHQENANYNREGKFYDSIRKHGWENFEWSIIYQSQDKEHTLNVMEPSFIKEYDTFNNGYNMTEGGEGCFGATKNKIWINDGQNHKRIEKTELILEGWSIGRIGLKRKKKMSDESKKLIGQKNKKHGVFRSLNNTEVTCPHCGKVGKNLGGMHRSHFNNCKQKSVI